MTSEASNPKPGHKPVRNSETFPCLLFLFSLFPQGLAVKPLDQKGLVCVQQQSRVGVGVAWGRRLHCIAAAKLGGRKEKPPNDKVGVSSQGKEKRTLPL